jgi:DNA-binding NtrC family response regulator
VPPGGGETILLVEDQAVVRELAARMLQSQGYSVITAADGDQGLEVLRRSPEKIHLLLSDVVLPGMKGETLAQYAVQIRPGIKVLFASGYTGDMVAYHKLVNRPVPLLQKPFTARALGEKVREVLDRS